MAGTLSQDCLPPKGVYKYKAEVLKVNTQTESSGGLSQGSRGALKLGVYIFNGELWNLNTNESSIPNWGKLSKLARFEDLVA